MNICVTYPPINSRDVIDSSGPQSCIVVVGGLSDSQTSSAPVMKSSVQSSSFLFSTPSRVVFAVFFVWSLFRLR